MVPFPIGEEVYVLSYHTTPITTPCTTCSGACKLPIQGQPAILVTCPTCRGQGRSTTWSDPSWIVSYSTYTIGLSRHQLVNPHFCEDDFNVAEKIEYMMKETGIFSGDVYSHKDLFLTKREAEAEAARRNEALLAEAAAKAKANPKPE